LGEDSARAIAEELRRQVGAAAQGTGPSAEARAGERQASGPGARLREGSMIQSRRARLTRSGTEMWSLVFDADASGLSDPPMIIAPCLGLELMEELATRPDGSPVILVSGQVLIDDGRLWLLPTSFRIARDRTPIKP
jgi:hypothetical protein